MILALVLMLAVQPAKVEEAPKLSTVEVIAINAVANQINKVNAEEKQIQVDAANVQADLMKAHPGYHWDFAKGQLVKNEVPKTEPKPDPSKKDTSGGK